MKTAIFKFLALSGVIALGCFVVYQVHTRIPPLGEQAPRAGDFQTVDDRDTDDDTTSDESPTTPATPTAPDTQRETETTSPPSLAGETSGWDWDAMPTQTESDLPTETATVPDTFWPEDPAVVSSAVPPAGLPHDPTGSTDESIPADESLSAPPGLTAQTESELTGGTAEETTDNTESIVTVGHDVETVDAAPRTLAPLGNVSPLPGAFIPDDEDWADDGGSGAIADGVVIPVEGVEPAPQANPFDFAVEPSGRDVPEQETGALPLLDFQAEPEPAPESVPFPTQPELEAGSDAATDPFAGFGDEPSPQPEPVLPADPSAAGFTEFDPLPTTPRVEANPFTFPEDDESGDDEETGPPAQDTEPAPSLFPAFGSELEQDAPSAGDGPESGAGADAAPLPLLFPVTDPEEPHAEPAAAPRLPALTDEIPREPAAREPAENSFPTISDDGEGAPVAAPQPIDPFAPQSPEPAPRNLADEHGADSPMALNLVGDATIDGSSATGAQQPELEIEKIAPPEATVGSPLIYAIHIRNVGRSEAHGVVVEDRIPRGTVLEGTIPQAELTDKVLTWKLGTIAPGQEETIRIKVTPTEAGQIGSVATVRFAAEVSAATSITSADLRLEMDGPQEVALGETAVFHYTLTNAGDGPARGAYIRCLLPAAFEHPGGADIEYEVGDLQPGQSSEVDLEVRAVEAGRHISRVLLNAGGRTHDQSELSVNVVPSRLLISREGPARRFVGRSAHYSTVVTNRSGAELTGITVVEQLPAGLELAAIPENGNYDPQHRTITWTISRLAAGASQTIDSTVVAREYGLHSTSIVARDRAGNEAHVTSDLQVAGFSTLEVDWEHDAKPLAVGEQVAMRLTIRNEGTAPARNLQAVFEVPPQMEFVNAQGPVPYVEEGRLIRFEDLGELAIDGEQSFDIVLTAAAPGNTKVSAQLRSADQTEPLRHDEPLFILQDEN